MRAASSSTTSSSRSTGDAATRYLVVGLARSGVAACEAIRRVWPEAEVVAADAPRDVDVGRLREIGVEPVLGGDVVPVEGLNAVVKSPGVPSQTDQVEAARAAGVPIWSEVELGARMLPNPIAGVTGTNGKTTTTELLGAMLRAGRRPVRGRGQRRPTAHVARRPNRRRRVDRLRALELSAGGHRHAPVPGRRAPERDPRPPRSARQLREVPALQASHLREPASRRHGCRERRRPRLARRGAPGPRRAGRGHPRAMRPRSTGSTPACAATTTSRTRSRRRRRRGRPASGARTSTAPCASSHPCRTGSNRSQAPRASSS